jgi:hypothetical protein
MSNQIQFLFFSSIIEQRTFAENIGKRSKEIQAWLVSIDVLDVLDGAVQLVKTVS